MNLLWLLLPLGLLVTSCMVPLGYTEGRSQGFLSDRRSAQYLQLSADYYRKGQEAQTAAAGDAAVLDQSLSTLSHEFDQKVDVVTGGATSSDEFVTGDDSGVPKRSLAGVALAEVLDASRSLGRSIDAATFDQEAEFQRVLNAAGNARGLYLEGQSIWPQNRVNYRWAGANNPSAAHRQALLDAMNTWTQASGGKVSFSELEASSWNNFQLTIGVAGCVVLQDSPLEAGVTGRATVGYQCGSVFGYLKLQPSLSDATVLRRTTLHELGHVLGLMHEHRRPDRDQWIDVASGGYSLGEADMSKVDEYVESMRWKAAQIVLGPWSITLYFPAWWKERNAELVGTFDMKSVMIYSGFLTRQAWTDPSNGSLIPAGSVVPWNTNLSVTDAYTIRRLYN